MLNNLTGARVLVKAEALQTAGSFKIRGALNRVLCLSEEQRARGVVAFSSGNFGQGLAVRPPGEPLLPAWRRSTPLASLAGGVRLTGRGLHGGHARRCAAKASCRLNKTRLR